MCILLLILLPTSQLAVTVLVKKGNSFVIWRNLIQINATACQMLSNKHVRKFGQKSAMNLIQSQKKCVFFCIVVLSTAQHPQLFNSYQLPNARWFSLVPSTCSIELRFLRIQKHLVRLWKDGAGFRRACFLITIWMQGRETRALRQYGVSSRFAFSWVLEQVENCLLHS